jgi:hypothetical protein
MLILCDCTLEVLKELSDYFIQIQGNGINSKSSSSDNSESEGLLLVEVLLENA